MGHATPRLLGHLEFDQVSFGYDADREVLSDVCFTVRPGMKVAIVGPTGSGKSTLLSLLQRFCDPGGGSIRLDGRPTTALDPIGLRRQIGLVPQDPGLFHLSLADNIRYGRPDATDEEVEAVARAAQVDSVAARLPDGYATVVGDGGWALSPGERQRVAIARALCVNPAIVLLDEATSSLDPETEREVQAALAELLENRTALIVAHRLATVMEADRIVVLNHGRVVQVGTHRELATDPAGLYARLLERQFGPAPAKQARRRTRQPERMAG